MKNASKDVDDYVARAPKEVQDKLQEIRSAIREVAPTAVESISYGMPYFDYKGRLGSVFQKRTSDYTYALQL